MLSLPENVQYTFNVLNCFVIKVDLSFNNILWKICNIMPCFTLHLFSVDDNVVSLIHKLEFLSGLYPFGYYTFGFFCLFFFVQLEWYVLKCLSHAIKCCVPFTHIAGRCARISIKYFLLTTIFLFVCWIAGAYFGTVYAVCLPFLLQLLGCS